jgi:hypothetical protein
LEAWKAKQQQKQQQQQQQQPAPAGPAAAATAPPAGMACAHLISRAVVDEMMLLWS